METDPLYFKSMTIQNIRCFGDTPQTLDLTDDEGKPAKWNLILGDNGVGKTTLLQALDYAIWSAKLLLPERFDSEETAHEGEQYRTKYARNFLDQVDFGKNSHGKIIVEIVNRLDMKSSHINSIYLPPSGWGVFQFGIHEECTFVVAYGPERRIYTEGASAKIDHFSGILTPQRPHLKDARNWLRELDYAASKVSDIQQSMVNCLRRIIELLISLLPDVDNIRITAPTKDAPEPDVEFLTPYGWVELKDVAYGYQSLVSWVVDFAYRLTERYPDSENPLAEPAICLIDELDLHLHPSWQRDVMGYLSEKFPNTQFIATVHSPLVVQAAPTVNANVAVLRRVSGEPYDHVVIDNDPEIIRSWRLDQLLASDLFATTRGPISPRNPDVQAKIDERRQILAKGEITTNDKKRLGEITKEIDMVPVSETSEQIRAQELLSESYKLLSKEKAEQ